MSELSQTRQAPELVDDDASDAAPFGFGHCNLPPWVLGSSHFQARPRPLHIAGVRRGNRALFARLASLPDAAARGEVFDAYMTVKYSLEEWREQTAAARRSLRNSYVRFLRGWGVDSNSIEGAVLKGWVESRFGLPPRYHRGPVQAGARSYLPFAHDRMLGHARTNAIDSQLDLLFEFCQYEARRRGLSRFKLYRGINDLDQHRVVARRGRREYLVTLNNLSSFTSDRECAWEFGNTVWEVDVPAQRVVLFAGLLPRTVLRGEAEHLVLGGQHWVKELEI